MKNFKEFSPSEREREYEILCKEIELVDSKKPRTLEIKKFAYEGCVEEDIVVILHDRLDIKVVVDDLINAYLIEQEKDEQRRQLWEKKKPAQVEETIGAPRVKSSLVSKESTFHLQTEIHIKEARGTRWIKIHVTYIRCHNQVLQMQTRKHTR